MWYFFLLLLVLVLVIVLIVLIYAAICYPGLFIIWPKKPCKEAQNHEIPLIKEAISDNFLLGAEELESVMKGLKENEPNIRKINSAMSVLGAAAYIDSHLDNYISLAQSTNPLMRKKYGFLYDKLPSHLSRRLGNQRCVFAADRTNDKIALPGFHIFNGDSPLARGWAVASLHVDKQELLVPWPEEEEFDYEKTLSYTLAIDVPGDSGLYLTDLKEKKLSFNAFKPWKNWLPLLLRKAEKYKIRYINGHCYLHHGKYFHMICPYKAKKVGGSSYAKRITLQGHALYCKSKQEWWLYW